MAAAAPGAAAAGSAAGDGIAGSAAGFGASYSVATGGSTTGMVAAGACLTPSIARARARTAGSWLLLNANIATSVVADASAAAAIRRRIRRCRTGARSAASSARRISVALL
jgi:hypothetical protein